MRGLSIRQASSVASLPTAGTAGRYCEFSGVLYHDNGAIWERLSPSIGDIKMQGHTTADPGWILCNRAAISRSTYSKLFARIGTTYGTGNGTTTFNIPGFADLFPMGNTPGASGGQNSANLAHGHTFSGTTSATSGVTGGTALANTVPREDHTHTYSGTTGSALGTHDNRPGLTGVAFFIYAGQ